MLIELPYFPSSEDDLRLVRFWMRRLSRVAFTSTITTKAFFNPQMIKLLFHVEEWRPKVVFHSQQWKFLAGFDDDHTTRVMEFCRDHLVADHFVLKAYRYFEGILDLVLKQGGNIRKFESHKNFPGSTTDFFNLIVWVCYTIIYGYFDKICIFRQQKRHRIQEKLSQK